MRTHLVCLNLMLTLTAPFLLQAQAHSAETKQYVYRTVNGKALKAFVFLPQRDAPKHPAILMFHGGAWQLGEAAWMFDRAREFAGDGMVAIAVDYRLALDGLSPVEGVEDACAAFTWVRAHAAEFRIDPKRVAGYGVSAGGHLVAAAATLPAVRGTKLSKNGRPNAMLLYSPALNVAEDAYFLRLMKGHGDSHDYSPSAFVSRRLPPTLIIQGEKDSIVFAKDAEAFCADAKRRQARCELRMYPGVGHLLTRNLSVQYRDFDSEPGYAKDAHEREDAFLRSLKYTVE